MALVQLNDYAVGDPNATASYTTLDATRRGLAEVSLSNYDNDSAPVVKVGSLFANAGALYELQTSDATPTGYSGISNSTTFYLYFDESAGVFIYSSTAPTWSDVYQGWYNGLDRALYSMYKDSGGTLYRDKSLLITQNKLGSPDGVQFGNIVKLKKYYKATAPTQDDIFQALTTWVPNDGDSLIIEGTAYDSDLAHSALYIKRTSSTRIQFYASELSGVSDFGSLTVIDSGGSYVFGPMEIMSNYDAIQYDIS